MRDSVFRDPDLPLGDRITDLLEQLTLDEKIALLHQHQAPIPRLGVPAFRTGTEALHGMAWLGPATVFPQAIGLATTWNPDLVRAVGSAVGDEVRGLHHKDPTRAGLNVWAPVVNPLRDPRWGRNEEGYAEDPWLSGVFGTAYARGLRGDDPRYLKTAPTLKHFLGYNNETDRHLTSSNLPPRVLHEYELPAFRAPLADGAAVAVMASYNLVNGRPAHLSPLIESDLRSWSEQEVMVVGDAAAVSNIAGSQGYHPDHPSGYAAALRAGIDNFTEDDADPGPTIERITEALRRGLLEPADVDRAVRRILSIRFRLGDFDPPESNPFTAITTEVINCSAHQELARGAARQSMVLLRNDGLLPLAQPATQAEPATHAQPAIAQAPPVTRVAVIGPLADAVYQDWYSGTPPYAVTALDGLVARLGADAVLHHRGVNRIALRVPGEVAATPGSGPSPAGSEPSPAGGYVRATNQPGGAPLSTIHPAPATAPSRGAGAGPETWLDVFDWGQGIVALRCAANNRHVGVGDDGVLVNDRPGPGEWVVRETFRTLDRGDGRSVLHHLASDSYVLVGADGVLRAEASSPERATGFAVEVVVDGAREAAEVARQADVAIVVLGNHPMVCGRETEDRADLTLPTSQDALLRAVHAANPRTVLVLSSSYPYAVGWADEHLPAILWSSHGGQEYGHALAAVLCGDAEPGGRLTQTWYHDAAELPDLLDYDIIATDATYLYYRGTPLYPFGHGLSYTSFDYSDLRLSADSVAADGEIEVTVRVRNVGSRPGEDVVQLYTRQRRSRVKQPLRQLRGFARIRLAPGEETTVRLPLRAADLAHWDVTRNRLVVERARHTVAIGRSCTELPLATSLTVHGESVAPRTPLDGPLRAVDHDEYAGTVPTPDGPGDAAVAARESGGWIRFSGIDFGAGVAGLTARVRDRGGSGGTTSLTLRLDDPVTGPIAGTVPIPAAAPPIPAGGTTAAPDTATAPLMAAGTLAWNEVPGRWHRGVTGVRDLYLLFDTPGATVSWLAFEAEPDSGRSETGSGGA